MRRGLGNPLRPQTPRQALIEKGETIQKRFATFRTIFQKDGPNTFFSPLPSTRRAEIRKYAEMQRALLIKEGKPEGAQAWHIWEAFQNDMEEGIDVDYQKKFMAWLMGKGLTEEHAVTPWGRQPQAMEIPEVRAWMEQILDNASATENFLLKLIFRGPQTLNEYALYYKYILHLEEYFSVEDRFMFIDFPNLGAGGQLRSTPNGVEFAPPSDEDPNVVGATGGGVSAGPHGSRPGDSGERLNKLYDNAAKILADANSISDLYNLRGRTKEELYARKMKIDEEIREAGKNVRAEEDPNFAATVADVEKKAAAAARIAELHAESLRIETEEERRAKEEKRVRREQKEKAKQELLEEKKQRRAQKAQEKEERRQKEEREKQLEKEMKEAKRTAKKAKKAAEKQMQNVKEAAPEKPLLRRKRREIPAAEIEKPPTEQPPAPAETTKPVVEETKEVIEEAAEEVGPSLEEDKMAGVQFILEAVVPRTQTEWQVSPEQNLREIEDAFAQLTPKQQQLVVRAEAPPNIPQSTWDEITANLAASLQAQSKYHGEKTLREPAAFKQVGKENRFKKGAEEQEGRESKRLRNELGQFVAEQEPMQGLKLIGEPFSESDSEYEPETDTESSSESRSTSSSETSASRSASPVPVEPRKKKSTEKSKSSNPLASKTKKSPKSQKVKQKASEKKSGKKKASNKKTVK